MLIVFLFLVLILCKLSPIEPISFKKSYSQITKEHDQTSINLTKAFDFIG